MADPPSAPTSPDDTGVGPDRESTTGTPRWVKVFGIIAGVVVLLLVILLFVRGPGGHGPARHTSSDDAGGLTPLSSVVTEHPTPSGDLGGLTPPVGGHE